MVGITGFNATHAVALWSGIVGNSLGVVDYATLSPHLGTILDFRSVAMLMHRDFAGLGSGYNGGNTSFAIAPNAYAYFPVTYSPQSGQSQPVVASVNINNYEDTAQSRVAPGSSDYNKPLRSLFFA